MSKTVVVISHDELGKRMVGHEQGQKLASSGADKPRLNHLDAVLCAHLEALDDGAVSRKLCCN